eukprot:TRINITY_DN77285_c0_g1_i1.p1 TRINITY_DN77285_c0_g1~~TRINITY_DN77285_c0_g1_i1.p1  ORF type:complete len:150 (+),score=10.43 TRINITY_DN77285_c0_g1_i1:104-553(+)
MELPSGDGVMMTRHSKVTADALAVSSIKRTGAARDPVPPTVNDAGYYTSCTASTTNGTSYNGSVAASSIISEHRAMFSRASRTSSSRSSSSSHHSGSNRKGGVSPAECKRITKHLLKVAHQAELIEKLEQIQAKKREARRAALPKILSL